MRNRKPSPLHTHPSASIILTCITPVLYYQEEELSIEELQEKLIDCTVHEFFEAFKVYNKNFFKYGNFQDIYYYDNCFSSMLLLFNEQFFKTYKPGYFYALPASLTGITTMLVKENYPNGTQYQKTVAYLENMINFKEGSTLLQFKF